ncbi:HEAT repeat domain-containing protein [Pseudarthrobacter sp. J1763]|uniref:HEAT repeat domain-containing protein n=1 Tax=Pseudarthrobacter sp. J1763 TaxID=3420445 RepID=UPI003D2C7C8C
MQTLLAGPVVVAVLVGSTAATAAVLLLLVLLRVTRKLTARRAAALEQRTRSLILQATVAEPDEVESFARELNSHGRAERAAAEKTILGLLVEVQGEAAESLTQLLEACGTIDRAVKDADARDAVVRARAAEVLGLTAGPQSLAPLLDLAVDPDVEVRIVAVRALGRTGNPSAVRPLLNALRSDSGVPTTVAASALLNLAEHSGTAIDDGFTDPDAAVRRTTAQLAGYLQSPGASSRLITLLGDSDALVRQAAARSLGQLHGSAAIQPLFHRAMNDAVPAVRLAAAHALMQLPEAWTFNVRTALATSTDPEVRYATAIWPQNTEVKAQ